MKIKTFNILVIIAILVSSCKREKIGKTTVKSTITQTSNKINQEKFIKESINKMDSIISNENLLEISTKYKKQDTTYWIEGAEFKKNKEKVIYFGSYYDKKDVSNDNNYTFLINKNGFPSFVNQELSIGSGKERKIISKDTFFFKNNKIYFWKNKQTTKKELIKKEKEILAIKKEIDSIMEW